MGHAAAAEIERVDLLFIAGAGLPQHFDETAGGDIAADMIIAEAGEPDARDSHAANGLAIVGEQGSVDGAIDDPAAFLERPDRCGSAKIETETIVPPEIIDRNGRAVPLDGPTNH